MSDKTPRGSSGGDKPLIIEKGGYQPKANPPSTPLTAQTTIGPVRPPTGSAQPSPQHQGGR